MENKFTNNQELNSLLNQSKTASNNRVLVIDNYDSFVYNLVHYLEEFGCEVVVKRNDEISLEEAARFDKILLSPGPGIPEEAGILKLIIREYASSKSIFGVCLGQQAIAEVFGGTLINLKKVYHGISSTIKVCVEDESLFSGLENEFQAGRYHSWVVAKELPKCLEATSFDENGEIMSLRHKEYDLRAVQFHPESILTPLGKRIMENWVKGPKSQQAPPPALPEGEGVKYAENRTEF